MRNRWEAAKLYHVNSSHVRSRLTELPVDEERRPLRFRTYLGSHRLDLPGRDFELPATLGDVLQWRHSVRDFRLNPLDLTAVGRLLHAGAGVRGYRKSEGEWVYDRPFPSAGGLYPLELYVATQVVRGLPDGIYHYDARAHQLEVRQTRLVHPELAEIALGQTMPRDANLVIAICAMFERTMWKYGERGYRYVWLDAGHVGQNLALIATALGLGSVGIGGFFDEELNRLFDLSPEEEEVIYLVCVGQPEEADDRRI